MKNLYIGLIVLVVGVVALGTYTNSATTINWNSIKATSEAGPLDKFLDETEEYLDGTSGITFLSNVEVFDANDTLTAAETGKVCVSIGFTGAVDSNNLILTLPPAAAGLTYTFVDANATATDDLWVTAGTGDTINGGTAAKSFKNTGDVVNASCTFVASDGTDWVAMPSAIGTWANDNN